MCCLPTTCHSPVSLSQVNAIPRHDQSFSAASIAAAQTSLLRQECVLLCLSRAHLENRDTSSCLGMLEVVRLARRKRMSQQEEYMSPRGSSGSGAGRGLSTADGGGERFAGFGSSGGSRGSASRQSSAAGAVSRFASGARQSLGASPAGTMGRHTVGTSNSIRSHHNTTRSHIPRMGGGLGATSGGDKEGGITPYLGDLLTEAYLQQGRPVRALRVVVAMRHLNLYDPVSGDELQEPGASPSILHQAAFHMLRGRILRKIISPDGAAHTINYPLAVRADLKGLGVDMRDAATSSFICTLVSNKGEWFRARTDSNSSSSASSSSSSSPAKAANSGREPPRSSDRVQRPGSMGHDLKFLDPGGVLLEYLKE